MSKEPHAAQWSFNLLINSAYFQSRCRLREGRGGGSLQQQQGGGGSAREERGLRGESLGMLCQMSRSLAHSSAEPLQGEQKRTCSQEGGRREEKLCRHGCCQSGSTWSPSPGCLSLAQDPGQVRGPSVVSLPSRELPQITEAPCVEPSQQQTALSTVRAAGRRGEGTCKLLIAAHPAWSGKK